MKTDWKKKAEELALELRDNEFLNVEREEVLKEITRNVERLKEELRVMTDTLQNVIKEKTKAVDEVFRLKQEQNQAHVVYHGLVEDREHLKKELNIARGDLGISESNTRLLGRQVDELKRKSSASLNAASVLSVFLLENYSELIAASLVSQMADQMKFEKISEFKDTLQEAFSRASAEIHRLTFQMRDSPELEETMRGIELLLRKDEHRHSAKK